MYNCDICGEQFEIRQAKASHMWHAHGSEKKKKEVRINQSILSSLEHVDITKQCEKCGNDFEVKRTLNKDGTQRISKKERRFCSYKCSNSHVQTEETNKKRSMSMTKEKPVCKVCGKKLRKKNKHGYCQKCWFKSPEFLIANKKMSEKLKGKSKSGNTKRSKNEILFHDLCKDHFNNVKHNEPVFNGWDADVIIEDIKTAVLWNGKWHYEKIMEGHSLKQVQNRDRLKLIEIKKLGWEAYIIKDMGKYNPVFVKEKFDEFISTLQ